MKTELSLHFPRALAATLTLALGLCRLAGADWPTFQHDNHRSALAGEALPADRLREEWVYQAPSEPDPAWFDPAKWDAYAGVRGLKSMRNYDPVFHVTVAGTNLFFGSTIDDSVHCLDARTGREGWVLTTDGPVRVPPTIWQDKIYFGSDDGHAYCASLAEGQVIWKRTAVTADRLILHNGRFIPFWPCRTGVMIDNGTAYFGQSMLPWKESYLCALDALTGKADGPGRYERKLQEVTLEGSLLATGDKLISPQGRVPPLLFERAEGKPLGSLEGGGGCFVVVSEEEHVFHGPGNKAGWVQESQGKDRSKVATFNGATSLVVSEGLAYILSENAVSAFDRKARREVWKHTGREYLALMKAGDTLYAGALDRVEAFHAGDGRLLWQAPVRGRAYGLAVADGALFVSTDQGAIHAFRPGAQPVLNAGLQASGAVVAAPDPVVPPVQDAGLVGRWVFQKNLIQRNSVTNLAGGMEAGLLGEPPLVTVDGTQALKLDGQNHSALLGTEMNSPELPVEAFSVEAWVKPERKDEWGAILAAAQASKKGQRGWSVGFHLNRFSFGLVAKGGTGKFTMIEAGTEFENGQWYHVVASYDGSLMSLFVNGKQEASSKDQSGPVHYPDKGYYELGAHHDDKNYHRFEGLIREVRVYKRALTEGEAMAHAAENPLRALPKAVLAAGPVLKFPAKGIAEIWWQTLRPSPTLLEFGGEDGPGRNFTDATLKTSHRVTIPDLAHNRVYGYTIRVAGEDKAAATEKFECDTFFNYNLVAVKGASPYPNDDLTATYEAAAEGILAESGITNGICLVLDCGDGRLAYELVRRSNLRILGLEADEAAVRRARAALMRVGIYGTRVTVRQARDLVSIPLVEGFANLIASDAAVRTGNFAVPASEVSRFLRPFGGVAVLGQPSKTREVGWIKPWLAAAKLPEIKAETRGSWAKLTRAASAGSGAWSHQYGSGNNSAYNGESLQGASSAGDLEVQWLGRPGPRAQPDRNGRKPSPLAANGRLYVQGLQRVITLDALNGSILWSRELPSLQRFNLPRDCSNWCADDAGLYVAMGDQCWKMDGATGEAARKYAVIPGGRPGWQCEWGFVSIQGDLLLGSAVKKGAPFVEYWGGPDAGWYDATTGPATWKVCSENLFACDRDSGTPAWIHQGGLIVNSTITVGGGRVYFAETRQPKVLASESRRVGLPELWEDLRLVALDLKTGRVVWDQPIAPVPGEVVVYLAQAGGRLVMVSSGSKSYNVYAWDEETGKPVWNTSFPWPKDNHGGHMARPAIVGDKVYVRPHAIDLATGKVLPQQIPGGGCGTYAATEKALFFRSGNVTVWDTNDGKLTSWSRLRPDCWLSTIPADGLLLSPEGGGGCSCGSWMETSIAFAPRALRK